MWLKCVISSRLKTLIREVRIYSDGSHLSSQIDSLVIDVMDKKGIDLSGKWPKRMFCGKSEISFVIK
jgi:protein-tyrosine-phosphatase